MKQLFTYPVITLKFMKFWYLPEKNFISVSPGVIFLTGHMTGHPFNSVNLLVKSRPSQCFQYLTLVATVFDVDPALLDPKLKQFVTTTSAETWARFPRQIEHIHLAWQESLMGLANLICDPFLQDSCKLCEVGLFCYQFLYSNQGNYIQKQWN